MYFEQGMGCSAKKRGQGNEQKEQAPVFRYLIGRRDLQKKDERNNCDDIIGERSHWLINYKLTYS
jgi:hypothetical protein